MCPVIGVSWCKGWAIHPVINTHPLFSFQTLVLSYEPFISLPFFSHYPGDWESHKVHLQSSYETIIFCMQTLLDLFTTRGHSPWTLLGMLHLRQHGMGFLNTRQGEVCMVAPPLLDVHSHFFFIRIPLDYWLCYDFSRMAYPWSTLYRSSLDSHWLIQDLMIFRSWPIPHKLCIVNHQGWSSFLYLFKLQR